MIVIIVGRAYLDAVRAGLEQIGKHLNELRRHEAVAQRFDFGNVAEQAHHVADELLFVGETLHQWNNNY